MKKLLFAALTIMIIGSCSKKDTTPATPAPIADFTYTGAGAAPANVTFTNTSTNATTYLWDFGDNGTSTSQSPQHTYSTPGVFTVKLTVNGAYGSNSTSKTVNISVAPVAQFTFSGANTAPSIVTFTNASTNATSYSWDFGDGGTSTLVNPVYTYSLGGSYTVILTATNSGGSSTYQLPITIIKPTELKVRVTDNLGSPQSGANVTLYNNYNDYNYGTNPVATTTTNANGYMYFSSKTSNISTVAYYFYISSGCKDNVHNATHFTTALVANQMNTYNNIILDGEGKIKVVNNVNNPYKITIDGVVYNSSLSNLSNETYSFISVGNHTVRADKISGFTGASYYTFNVTVGCGTLTTLTFP